MRRLCMVLALVLLAGCSTYDTRFADDASRNRYYSSVFPATRNDAYMIRSEHSEEWDETFRWFYALDLPISIPIDTLCFPIDFCISCLHWFVTGITGERTRQ